MPQATETGGPVDPDRRQAPRGPVALRRPSCRDRKGPCGLDWYVCGACRRSRHPPALSSGVSRVTGKMFGVPIRFEIRIDLAINEKNAGRPFPNPGLYRIEVSERPYRRCPRAVAPGNRSKIRFRKLNDVDRIPLPAKEVYLGSV